MSFILLLVLIIFGIFGSGLIKSKLEDANCPAGTFEYRYGTGTKGTLCYYMTGIPVAAAANEIECDRLHPGGKLAIIPDSNAIDVLSERFPSADNEYYVGIGDAAMEGEYRNSENELQQFLNWRPNQPNDDNATQNCVRIMPEDDIEQWSIQDKSCYDHFPALCSVRPSR